MNRRFGVFMLVLALFLLWPCGADAGKKIKEGTITVSFGPGPVTMDPHTSSSAITSTVHRYVFDTLTHRPRGKAYPVPWAAKSFKNINPKLVEFQMREGVKFTNGEDVDAAAVKFSLMRPLAKNFKTVQRKRFKMIDRVEVVSKWVARVHMKYPDPNFPNRMANRGHLVPPKYYSRIKQKEAAIKPIGSGPYKMVRWRRGVELAFEANPDYWHPEAPKVKGFRVVPIPEMGTRVAALLKGEVDVIRDIPGHFIPRIEANPNTKIITGLNGRMFRLSFVDDVGGGPTQDVRVRRAVAHAIDRDLIIKDVVQGYGAKVTQFLHQWTEGHDPDAKYPYQYNPEKAKKLLAEAGYPNGFSIDFISASGRYPKDKEVAEAVAGMLRKVGIRANYKALKWRTYTNRFRGRFKPGRKSFMTYSGYGNGSGDSSGLFSSLATCGGGWSSYCNPALEKFLDVVNRTIDMKERGRMFRALNEALVKDVGYVLIWQQVDVYGMNKKVMWKVRSDDRMYAFEMDIREPGN
ncbi:ABC transporter substrate-binding protein [Nitrospinota bacterium]